MFVPNVLFVSSLFVSRVFLPRNTAITVTAVRSISNVNTPEVTSTLTARLWHRVLQGLLTGGVGGG